MTPQRYPFSSFFILSLQFDTIQREEHVWDTTKVHASNKEACVWCEAKALYICCVLIYPFNSSKHRKVFIHPSQTKKIFLNFQWKCEFDMTNKVSSLTSYTWNVELNSLEKFKCVVSWDERILKCFPCNEILGVIFQCYITLNVIALKFKTTHVWKLKYLDIESWDWDTLF